MRLKSQLNLYSTKQITKLINRTGSSLMRLTNEARDNNTSIHEAFRQTSIRIKAKHCFLRNNQVRFEERLWH